MATIKRYESIEISIPNGSQNTRFYFPDLPNLRNALIDRLVLYNSQVINPSVLTGGTPATSTDIIDTSITLYAGDQQLIYNCPLTSFLFGISSNYLTLSIDGVGGYNIPLDFNGQIISWTKSYISSPYTQNDSPAVYSFGCFYHF